MNGLPPGFVLRELDPAALPDGFVLREPENRSLYQQAKEGVSNFINPPAEDIPEASYLYQKAGEQELELYRRYEDPSAQITQDEHGNTVFEGEKGRVYPDKPGLTWKDIPEFMSDATDFAQVAAPSIAGGVITAPAQWPAAVTAMGATGLLSGGFREGAESLSEGRNYDASVPLTEAALNLGGEGLARGLYRLLGPVASKVFGKKADEMHLVTQSGKLTEEGEALLAQAKQTPSIKAEVESQLDLLKKQGAMNAEEAQRIDLFLKHKLEPTRPQVSRNADDFTRQTEALKSSGPVRDRLESQDSALSEAFESVIPRSGHAGEEAFDLIRSQVDEADTAISGMYASARESAPDAKIIKLPELLDTVRKSQGEDALSNGVYSAIKGQLKNMGLVDGRWRPTGKITPKQAEDLRIYMNSVGRNNPQGQNLVSRFKEALDNDVGLFAGEDAFKAARAGKAKLEHSLNRPRSGRRDQRKAKGLLRDVVDNRVGRGEFIKRIKTASTRAEDIGDIKVYLKDQGKTGTDSWNAIRRSVMDDIVERTFRGPLGEQGVQKPTRAALESSLKAWPDDKLAQVFDPPEMAFLKDMQNIMKLREAPANPQGYGPSSMGFKKHLDSAVNGLSRLVPYGGDLAAGMVKKLGEIAGEQKLARQILEASGSKQFTTGQASAARKLITAAMKSKVTPVGGVVAGSVIAEG